MSRRLFTGRLFTDRLFTGRLFTDRRAAAAGLATLALISVTEGSDTLVRSKPGDVVRDEGTIEVFSAALTVAIAAGAASVLRPGAPPLPRRRGLYWIGLALAWCGVGVNRWARYTLASTYRPVVTLVEGQQVVETGPYRFIRHPMYLGGVLMCAGTAAALGTAPAAAAWLLPPAALVRRITVEERVLNEALGERYAAFARGRARLFPGIW